MDHLTHHSPGQRGFFASDLHGRTDRYRKLFAALQAEQPDAVFLGGDLLPSPFQSLTDEAPGFLQDVLVRGFARLREQLKDRAPKVFLIPGNDDGRTEESAFSEGQAGGLWDYVPSRRSAWGDFPVYGYAFVPPTPFRIKDWEKYDVSRYVDPGCLPPEDGMRSNVDDTGRLGKTIESDLEALIGGEPLDRAIILFHAPPYQTALDRAALDGRTIDHVPLDVHVGSIAIRRFIEKRQPWLTLHGHVHESARITGRWLDRLGRTCCFQGAHDGPELALIRFDPTQPALATRELL